MNATEILEEIMILSHDLNIFDEVFELARIYCDGGNNQQESYEMAYFQVLKNKGLNDPRN